MAETESRVSRWSRLKSKGGADAREETRIVEEKQREREAEAAPVNEFATLPGGARVRNFVPAMAPLAPDPEEDDDDLTRGIGHAEPEDEELDSEVAALPESKDAETGDEDIFAGIEDEEMSDAEREIVAGLPPLESLTRDSDFTPFLRDEVPNFLKRRALRLLWRVNPFFNFRDGLNDYDEDFNIVHRIIDEMVGNYRVGRGHLSDQELHDMMPEEARKAFDDDKDDGADETKSGVNEIAEVSEESQKTAENAESDTEDDDNLGDGEDDPDL